VINALNSLFFDDVVAADKITLDWDATYTCKLDSGMVYTVALAKKDNKNYIKVAATAPNVAENRLAWISSMRPLAMARATTMAKTPRAMPQRANLTITRTKAPFLRVCR